MEVEMEVEMKENTGLLPHTRKRIMNTFSNKKVQKKQNMEKPKWINYIDYKLKI